MYRTSDPRFRRRLNELGATVENATESAQSGLYIFGERYIQPCLSSIGSCLTTCVDASCPSLNISQQRERSRRQQQRSRRGRAELSFDFYDDWDDLDETDGLLGWGGGDEFDRLLAGSGAHTQQGYGAITAQQPGRQRGMSYPKGRRKSGAGIEPDPTVIPGSTSFFGKLFGGKALRYKPSAADLQEHPGARRLRRDMTEGEALLEESETSPSAPRPHKRARSGTATSGETMESLSSRGDIFPSDEELDDAIPLDDEFAMVLERRNTQSGPESQTESSSGRTRSERRGKRPSTGSRTSTRRTVSSRSTRSSTARRRSGSTPPEPINIDEQLAATAEESQADVLTLSELKLEERRLEQEEEEAVERKRQEALRAAAERGLPMIGGEDLSSKEATPKATSPAIAPAEPTEEPNQLPTPLSTDDEEREVLDEAEKTVGKGQDTKP